MMTELNTRTMEGSHVSFVQKLLLSNNSTELKCYVLIWNDMSLRYDLPSIVKSHLPMIQRYIAQFSQMMIYTEFPI